MITDIHLQNFRSYIDESFEFSPKVNIIVGPNASGKTSLLESLLVCAKGSSFKGKDAELINIKKRWARIEASTEDSKRVIKIERTDPDKSSKTFEINTQKIFRLNMQQTIPVVLFEPNHLLLLSGSPELRRNYLDEILEQTIIGYKTTKANYRRALAQRNALLKRSENINSELFVWNIRLSELGGKLFKERQKLVETLNKDSTKIYDTLSGNKEKISLSYKTSININSYETNLLKKLEQSIKTDTLRGFTSHGPHRDDVQILLNNKPAGEVASRGETRSIVLTLKLIETNIIEQARQQKPILLFDDVFSELDGARRLALTNILESHQTVITTTDADIVVQHFMESNNIIPLDK